MEVILIAAMTSSRVIGYQNAIPWHIPSELNFFKKTTWGHPLIMGRKTHESIGRPLPGRRNIVLSRQVGYRAAGCEHAPDLHSALQRCQGDDKVFIIGGESIFTDALPMADTLLLTIIDQEFQGDTYFPAFDEQDFPVTHSTTVAGPPIPYRIQLRNRKPAHA
jgi:dihydrofolate reductase